MKSKLITNRDLSFHDYPASADLRFAFIRDEETGHCYLDDYLTGVSYDLSVESYRDGLRSAQEEVDGILAKEAETGVTYDPREVK